MAGCLGWYMQHCSSTEAEDLLACVLSGRAAPKSARLGNALTLAAIAEHAALRYLVSSRLSAHEFDWRTEQAPGAGLP